LTQTDNLTTQVNQIATAAEEQTAATSDITQNIQQVPDEANKSSNIAYSSVEATTRLDQVAHELQSLISHYMSAIMNYRGEVWKMRFGEQWDGST
jgi:methyl-accepting chemotaxis protein